MAVDLKPHNLETYDKVKEIFKTKNRACCVQPTGSGKSYLALKLFEDNPSARKLVLEPQHYIREQLQAKVTEDMGTVQFITYSKLAKMSDEDIAALEPDIIVLDEFHRAGAKEWGGKGVQRLLESYPESKVLGLSATPIRYLDSGRNMAEELFEGAMANNMSLAEAIVQRILPLPRYISGLYCLNGEVESINKKIEQSYNSPEEKKTLLKQVREMKKQLDKSNGVSSILHKYILEPNGKYIVFCKDIKHLNQMKPMLEQWFAEAGFTDIRLYVVHSKNENKDAEFKKFKEDDGDGIRLCLVVSMLNEGVHVDDIDGVIMLRNTISAGLFFQQIGRAISCNSKGIPLILDLVANAQSVTECNLKKDIEMEIQKERERNKGFSSEGLEVEKFFVMDEVLDVISAFKGIEGRLVDSWDIYIKALEQYKEREGDCLVPGKHVEVIEDGMEVKLGQWANRMRLARDGIINFSLNVEKIKELDRLGFIWAVEKYRFKNKVNACIDYFNRNGKLPCRTKVKEDIIISCFISGSRKEINNNPNYPKWKIELLNQIPTFFEEKESIFDKFYRMALLYKERNGHVNIVRKDVIDGYNIGIKYQYLYLQYKDGKLTDEQVSKLQCIGLDITIGKREKEHTDKMNLVKQAINEGVAISRQNKFYKDVNLYNWRIEHKNFKKEELELINKLIPTCYKTAVKIIDVVNDRILGIYESISEAGRALYEEYQVVANANSGTSIICRYLKGKVKNPVYKGRFIFQYVNSTDQSEPA